MQSSISEWSIFGILLAISALVVLAKCCVVVPQQSVFLLERLGRLHKTLTAGFHVVLPFVDIIRYRMSLKETAVDVEEQICITRDNVQVRVDGVLYIRVMDPMKAAYGVSDYMFAISQLAQTGMRSEIGRIDLDKTFEERTRINDALVRELDEASEPWGVKILRYEIRNISPPHDVLAAMEKQMRAEREKRATILASEGERDAKINSAEGNKQERIKQSEANRQQQVNEAEGAAQAILTLAQATATSLKEVAAATQVTGGHEAITLRLAEGYIKQFGELAKNGNTLIVPANVGDPVAMLATAMNVANVRPAPASPKR